MRVSVRTWLVYSICLIHISLSNSEIYITHHTGLHYCLELLAYERHCAATRFLLDFFFVCVMSPSGGTHISEVEGNLQVVPEQVGKVRVHVQHLQQVISEDLVKVAVGQSPDISVRFTRPSVQIDCFTKYVVLAYGSIGNTKEEQGETL